MIREGEGNKASGMFEKKEIKDRALRASVPYDRKKKASFDLEPASRHKYGVLSQHPRCG